MKVLAISDLHGDLIPITEESDLICICGDISPLSIQINRRKMKSWLVDEFKPWCENLPCDKVLFIGGNHDFVCSDLDFMYTQFPKDKKVTYLYHEEYTYISKSGQEYKIFGTPFCKIFGNWAFMESDDILEEYYNSIPENLDILITHDTPYGVSDIIFQHTCPWYDGKTHLGNKALTKAILEKKPSVVLHGHIHSSDHNFDYLGVSKVVNCSIKDEDYKLYYDPIVFEI